jgi:hypothetical protein
MDIQLQHFQNHAKDIKAVDDSIIDILYIKNDNLYGFLYIDTYSEELDNHCSQCMKEILPIAFNGCIDFPYVAISISVGPTKYQKILAKEIPFNFEILQSLLF